MMGGRIWVESEAGRGSTFHFTVLFLLQQGPALVENTINVHGLRVLIVDDNATNRLILVETLNQWLMKPTAVPSGLAALAALAEAKQAAEPFHLLLLDEQMPEMDGFELAKQIQQGRDSGCATIMMLSSSAQHGNAARCQELNIEAYLTKPVGRSDLLEAIRKALNSRTSRHARVTRPSPQDSQTREQSSNVDPMRVLLAEDNLVNQRLAVRVLAKHGHTVVVAGNGLEALKELKQQHFDLVLMDVQMPEMNGLEATAAIREEEKRTGRHLPIVAMTANAMKGDRELCLEAGMDGYVSKPIKVPDLLAEMGRVVLSLHDEQT
jgi:CheY-like chemotaxis protein